MIVLYLDASAWVKRYYQGHGTDWIQDKFAKNSFFACATLGIVEVMAAIARKGKSINLDSSILEQKSQELQRDWQSFIHIHLTKPVIDASLDLAKTLALCGADAVHLASALELQQRLTDPADQLIFVTSGNELLRAAQLSGLTVIDPLQPSAS